MKLYPALNASDVDIAIRNPSSEDEEPNVVLVDHGHTPPLTKAFRAHDRCAWTRRKVREAKKYDDWVSVPSMHELHEFIANGGKFGFSQTP